MEKPVQDALDLVLKAQKNVGQLLSGPKYINNMLEINANFKRITERLTFIGGILGGKTDTGERTGKHGPITNWMGKAVERDKKASLDDVKKTLTPDQLTEQNFVTKVNRLYTDITNFPAQSIITNYRLPEDVLVLRGVAKKAKVPDFATREINIAFINDIVAAIAVQTADAGVNKKVDNKTGRAPVVLTQELIDADPELIKLNAKVGDTMTFVKGRKVITAAETDEDNDHE